MLPRMDLAPATRTRRIVVAAFPEAQMLDVVGPLEVFSTTQRLLADRAGEPGPAAYEVAVAAPRAGAIPMSSGIELAARYSLADVPDDVDTLLVAGGDGSRAAARDPEYLAFLRERAPRVRRLGSVCSGALVLAAAGLLDGRRATTHWAVCDTLARQYPKVRVDRDPIFVCDVHVGLIE